MNIRSLLLGSAAALVAASGAQAADAIIVEAEPMEYVKVCDMYGAGFFYIPGTEICMNINGYVRSTYSHAEYNIRTNLNQHYAATTTAPAGPGPLTTFATAEGFVFLGNTGAGGAPAEGDLLPLISPSRTNIRSNTSNWNVRGRLNFDVRNETEYGTLRSELRIQGGDADATGDQNVAINRAVIELAGFRLGYDDTYWTTNHGYGAGNPAINDGLYSYDQGILFDYTAQLMDGVAVTVGIQDSEGGAFGASSPDIYAGINATFGALNVAATAIRDDYIDVNTGKSKDEWAYKVSAMATLGDSGWSVGGWYAADDGHTQYVSGYFSRDIDEEWGVQISGTLSDNLSVYGVYSEASGEAAQNALKAINAKGELNEFSIGTIWAPVANLEVQIEYTQGEQEFRAKPVGAKHSVDYDNFQVRVTRSF